MEEPAVELEADKGLSHPEPEPEQSSENHHPETSVHQDRDSVSPLPSLEPLSDNAAELKDIPNILNIQDNIPNRQDIIRYSFFSASYYSAVSGNVMYVT